MSLNCTINMSQPTALMSLWQVHFPVLEIWRLALILSTDMIFS